MAGRVFRLRIVLVLSTNFLTPSLESNKVVGAPLASQLSIYHEPVADYQATQQQPIAAFPYSSVAVAILAAGIIGLVLIWYWQGRDRKSCPPPDT